MSALREAHDPEGELVAERAFDRNLLARLLAFARPHWGSFAWSFVVLAGVLVCELLGPWIIRRGVDGPIAEAERARDADPAAFEPGPFVERLKWYALAYLGLMAVNLALRYFEVAQIQRTGQRVIHDLRTRLFEHLQRLPLAWFDRRSTGSLVTRVTSDVENLNEMFTSGVIVLGFDLLKIAGILGVLFWIEWRLALVVVALTPVLIGISLAFRGGALRAYRAVRARLAAKNGYLQEVLQGMRVVQVFQRERRVSGRFAALLDDYLKANVKTVFLFALFFPAIDCVVTLIQASIVWTGGARIPSGELSYGVFLQFWFYLALLLDPIRELGERYNILQSAFAAAERIFGILDTPAEAAGAATIAVTAMPNGAAPAIAGHVRFENVSFGYAGGREVLTELSFEIPVGRTVAVVGATGAGKTTIASLLLGFYRPSRGRVTIDGLEIAAIDPSALRARMGLVLQEDFLFAGTVRENLLLDRPGIDDAALERALAASQAAEVVARLPQGLDTVAAERGVTFSTGERQLLAIARALAGDPRLVILDEATASVDSLTEAKIERATRELLRGRSALVIAHRLSTVRRADEILVMHKGRLRERGTHAELLAQGGLYARLHRLQFETEEQPETLAAPPAGLATAG